MQAPQPTISSDKSLLDLNVIQTFLNNSYWAFDRSPEDTRSCIENTHCYGVYLDGQQIGFTRVLSDKTVFAYLMDVFIVKEQQGKGYAKLLLRHILADPEFKKVKRWVLITKDAQTLYAQVGFEPLEHPERFMEINLRKGLF
jgi:GNAT superfamily N-acetyltransferase